MNHYLLLTPGPLSTSETVKQAMLKDWCTWDDEYNVGVVQSIRQKLVSLATNYCGYTSVLMQGSGTASVEAVLGGAIGQDESVLIIDNGAYGKRMVEICRTLKLNHKTLKFNEVELPDISAIEYELETGQFTHLAMVHCETTTGMLNPIREVAELCKSKEIAFILDAMSSFGGIEFDIGELDIAFMISSANKCIQGVPGFGFILAKREEILKCKGRAKSVSLDIYSQWKTMEECNGKWRFTSPTHVVRAFAQALNELEGEGGITARAQRYRLNQSKLCEGMKRLGFQPLLPDQLHSSIITSFYSPNAESYDFNEFYTMLKKKGFVIYPGKVSDADCFRIGNIGEVAPSDIERLLVAIKESMFWN